ncbi:MAG: Gmad2 immunoglobulin-like domain-containing protein [Patescibacteria group bacterium]
MKQKVVIAVAVLVVAGAGWAFFGSQKTPLGVPTPTPQPITISDERIRVSAPLSGAKITSPLVVRGEARGTWYFEASFPVRLRDANGKELAVKPAQAQGEWMTTEFVPFEAALTFTKPETKTGTLILEKDNPSGLPEHAAHIEIPVVFE